EICRRVLRAMGISEEPGELPKIETRLDVTEAVNNCMLVSDRFTCDLPSLVPALEFASRRRVGSRSLTLLVDRMPDLSADELRGLMRLYGIDRLIGIGSEYEDVPGAVVFHNASELMATLSAADFSSELIVVKGEPDSVVHKVAERLRLRHHETVLEVNLDAVIHNFNHFKAMLRPSTGLVAMVKASGYGAGSYELAKTLQSHGAAYLAVAVVDEGEELRRAGITMPIMVLNPKVTNYTSLFANRLEPEVFSFDMLGEIIREADKRGISNYPVHIKFDTGMHRLGFLREDIPALGRVLRDTSTVSVRSVFSHLATADCLDQDDYTLGQLSLFDDICREMTAEIGSGFLRHILNSAGIARFPQWQYDLCRLGISLYGVDTLGIPETSSLKTVSSLRSIIISLKHWPKGTSIGYARRTVLDHDAVIATVPVGYADGLNRRLSNGAGSVMVRDHRCPIVGNICMDACMIDVTSVGGSVAVGESVEFFGNQIAVSEVADVIGTIPYEVLTSVSPRVKRVYYRE
ncbi:MAG: alanine racemase, partial [Muribaculaceae bacterium]|nr:alanine racemase [Muribaculaceae bacterium]